MLKIFKSANIPNLAKLNSRVSFPVQWQLSRFSYSKENKNEPAVKVADDLKSSNTTINKRSLKSKQGLSVEYPKLDVDIAKNVKKIISLNVSKDLVTWMVVDSEGNILEWNHITQEKEFDDFNKLNFEEDYNQLKTTFNNYVPKDCSVYLFETRKYKAVDAKYVPLMIKINRFEIMFQCIIKNFLDEAQNSARIYNLSRLNVGKKFRIVIGNERVQSSDVVKYILKKQENIDYKYLNQMALKSPDDFEEYFLKEINQSQVKESIAKNYLQCACFVKTIRDCLENVKEDIK